MDSILSSELNSLRDQCDWLDYPGTPGKKRLRETCRLELGHFMLYVACADPFPTREQAMLLNCVWDGVHPSVCHYEMGKTLDELGFPSVSESETLAAFIKGNKAERLIRAYKVFGSTMAGFGRSIVSEGRYRRFVDEMKEISEAGLPDERGGLQE